MKKPFSPINRRGFLKASATAIASFTIVPGSVLGLNGAVSPNSKLNIACVGIGGQGAADLDGVSGENIVALCDVDSKQGGKSFERFPKAKTFKDFRRMFDAVEKDIDAAVIATPDHVHAAAVLNAIRRGKHVYCEKPLAHSVYEVRTVMEEARKHKVVTQLGNQGHSYDSIRTFCEYIWDGAIGNVREVHAMCNSVYSHMNDLAILDQKQAVPETLDWDLWLGPAQNRPYNSTYVPGKWRSWMPFGTGVIGDWTCHVVDPVFWALKLGAPSTIEAETGDYDPKIHGDTFPKGSIVRYEFPAIENRPAVKLIWYDGANRPAKPEELDKGQLPGIGALVVGDKGKILYGSHGAAGVKLLPDSRMKEYKEPAKTIPRSPGHHKEWIDACKNGKQAESNFNYGGPLAEVALLGVIAMRVKNRKLEWDGKNMRFTNSDEANQFIKPTFREGWGL